MDNTLSSDVNYESEFWIIFPVRGFNKYKWITTRKNKVVGEQVLGVPGTKR